MKWNERGKHIHALDDSFVRDCMPEVLKRLKAGERLKTIAADIGYSYGWCYCCLRRKGYSLRALTRAYRKYRIDSIQTRLPFDVSGSEI